MLSPEDRLALGHLLQREPLAALGTLRKGDPFVSMVPWVLAPEGTAFWIQVSQLATHTRDMLAHPNVGFMVQAPLSLEVPVRATARVSFACEAVLVAPTDPAGHENQEYARAQAAYVARFPQSVPLFGFGDFRLFRLQPRYARYVGGFARASTIMPPELGDILAHVPPSKPFL